MLRSLLSFTFSLVWMKFFRWFLKFFLPKTKANERRIGQKAEMTNWKLHKLQPAKISIFSLCWAQNYRTLDFRSHKKRKKNHFWWNNQRKNGSNRCKQSITTSHQLFCYFQSIFDGFNELFKDYFHSLCYYEMVLIMASKFESF